MQHHHMGDDIFVPTIADMDSRKVDADQEIAKIIIDGIRKEGKGMITRNAAAMMIKNSEHVLAKLSDSKLRDMVASLTGNVVVVGDDMLVAEDKEGSHLIFLK